MSLLSDLLNLMRPSHPVVIDDEVERAREDIEVLRQQVGEQGDRMTAVEVRVGVRGGPLRETRDTDR